MPDLHFLHLSDIHYCENYANKGIGTILSGLRHPGANVADCLRKEKQKDLDFVLLTGDLTQEGDEKDFKQLRNLIEKELGGLPMYSVPGNHDPREAYYKGFLAMEPPMIPDLCFHHKGLRIIALDSGHGIQGLIKPSQLEWLTEILKTPSERGTLLALHHPLLPDQEGLGTADCPSCFKELVLKSDVIGIYTGHTHHNLAAHFAGKPYFTAGSMAYALRSEEGYATFEGIATYSRFSLCENSLTAQVRLAAPVPSVVARLSMDKLSQLFTE